jgi:hypothetical protein
MGPSGNRWDLTTMLTTVQAFVCTVFHYRKQYAYKKWRCISERNEPMEIKKLNKNEYAGKSLPYGYHSERSKRQRSENDCSGNPVLQ